MNQLNSAMVVVFSFLICLATAQAQQEMETSEVDYDGNNWLLEQIGEAGEKTFLGRRAMFLERSQLTLQGHEFSEGVIEFDLATEHASGFVGVNFRDDSNGTGEQFYVRFHQSGRPDSTQYLAQLNGLASWQLHAGPNDATAIELGINQWIPIRIVVQGDKADIFIRDMITPALHIAHLRTDNNQGRVTFYAFDRPGMTTGAYFSQVSVRPLAEGEGVVGSAREEPPVAESVFRTWTISSVFNEEQLLGQYELDKSVVDSLTWKEVTVEENGILNIARYTQIAPEAQTVLVKLVLNADAPVMRQFNCGYSDRVRIYVNGKQRFYGNSQWRSRDHRFLGTVGLHDAVILHLDEGKNEVIAAVSESFGGWGFTGQIEDREGVIINP
jgi:hypothetical protein